MSKSARIRLGISGARGVPGLYGGFETVAAELGPRLVERGFDVTVYCRSRYSLPHRPSHYRGVRLVYLPALRQRSLESPSAELACSIHALGARYDILYVLGFRASAVYAPHRLIRRLLVFNTDGFDWQRSKWPRIGRRYLKLSERLGVGLATGGLVVDSRAVGDYYRQTYNRHPIYLTYGAPILTGDRTHLLEGYGLVPRGYYLLVARLEPENMVTEVIEGFLRSKSSMPLAVVGGLNYQTEYGNAVRRLGSDRVHLLGGVYRDGHLDALYQNCFAYIHGHAVGGTNPSLVRAMGAGALVLANDVVFNREVLSDAGLFWSPAAGDLPATVALAESDHELIDRLRRRSVDRVKRHYDWEAIADGYAHYFEGLAHEAGPVGA